MPRTETQRAMDPCDLEGSAEARRILGDALIWFNQTYPEINPMDQPDWVIDAKAILVD